MKSHTAKEPLPTLGVLFALLTGTAFLLGILFYVEEASVLGFVLLAPLIGIVLHTKRRWSALLYGWWFGFVFLLTVAAWILEAYSARWVTITPEIGLMFSLPIMVLTSALLGLCFGGFAFFVHALRPLLVRKPLLLYRGVFCLGVASAFTFFEYLRMVLFALVMSGSKLAEPFFSVGFLGYLASPFSGLRMIAPVTEVYGLSFLLVMINALVVLIVLYGSKKKRPLFLSLVVLALVSFSFGLTVFIPKNAETTIAIGGVGLTVLSETPELEKARQVTQEISSSRELLQRASLIVFPETFGSILAHANELGSIPSLISARVEGVTHATFRAGIFTSTEGAYLSEKKILVPFGEYLPAVASWVVELLDPLLAQKLARFLNAVPSENARHLYTLQDARIDVLFCNEAWAPEMPAMLKESKNTVVVVIASHAAFEHSFLLETQQKRMLQIRAASRAVPVVQVTNRGVSYVIDRFGNVLNRYQPGESFLAEVPLAR